MTEPRVPPHSIDAEQAVLGGLMLAPEKFDRVAARISDADFWRKDHQLIFRSIVELARRNQPFDCVTLGDWFEAQKIAGLIGDDTHRGVQYVYQLGNTQASAANIGAHVEIVREKSLRRRVIDGCARVIEEAFASGKDEKAEQLVDRAIGGLMRLHKAERNVECNMRDALRQAWAELVRIHDSNGALPGLTTGLAKLDEHLGGFHNGDLVVIGGRPSMGKTAMLFGMARAAALAGAPTGIVSGEQPAQQLGARMLSLYSGVPAAKMRSASFNAEEWGELSRAMSVASEAPIQIMDRAAPSIAEVSRLARRWKREHGIRALYVDYLQRLEAPGEKRWERVGVVASGLKNIARDLDIPVIALAQVKRDVEARGDKRPRMGDLCDSSDIEKEADQIITLYRDDYYEPESKHRGTAEILIDKNRHGETAFCRVAWVAEQMRFADLARDYRDPTGDEEEAPRARATRGRGNVGSDKVAA